MRWAKDYGIDGVFVQRFLSEVTTDPVFKQFRDEVTINLMAAAEAHGRVFAIEYDISGATEATLVTDLENDWKHLVDDLHVTASPSYLHHRNQPLVMIWGFGFSARPDTPADANALLDWFGGGAAAPYRATVAGGVPTYWRTLTGDADPNTGWTAVYPRFAVLSPWMVGRYSTDANVDSFHNSTLAADLAATSAAGVDYLPVVFPGFSWANLQYNHNPANLNQIPRRAGAFFWKQFDSFVTAGCTMAFVAMFDEVDEGTAMFKIAPNAAAAPTTGLFLDLDADGTALSSDFYLRLAGAAGRVLHGQAALTPSVPVSPM
jgi:hypothetical protein